MRKYIKKTLVQYLAKHLLKAITEDDVLRMTNKGWFLHKRKLGSDEIEHLKEEAKSFKESILWKMMSKDIEYIAFVTGRKAKTDDENLACHYMFYNLDIIERYLNNCSKL